MDGKVMWKARKAFVYTTIQEVKALIFLAVSSFETR